MLIASKKDLFKACRTLFDIEHDISLDFLEYLQLSGIKTAYRKKAFETHPDRTALLNETGVQNNSELFHSVQQAYEHLTNYLKAREKGFRLSASRSSQPQVFNAGKGPSTGNATDFYASCYAGDNHDDDSLETEKYHTGDIPARKLLFGHYLYYAGYINWRLIIQALIWQRTQRPRLGELAARFGWFTKQDIIDTLKNRTLSQPFGQTAVRLGLLEEHQLKVLLFQQNRLQKKIGAYFVESNMITPEQLTELVSLHQQHNTRYGRINEKSSKLF